MTEMEFRPRCNGQRAVVAIADRVRLVMRTKNQDVGLALIGVL